MWLISVRSDFGRFGSAFARQVVQYTYRSISYVSQGSLRAGATCVHHISLVRSAVCEGFRAIVSNFAVKNVSSPAVNKNQYKSTWYKEKCTFAMYISSVTHQILHWYRNDALNHRPVLRSSKNGPNVPFCSMLNSRPMPWVTGAKRYLSMNLKRSNHEIDRI